MEVVVNDYKIGNEKISFKIYHNKINGIYTEKKEDIIDIFKLNNNVYIDNTLVNNKNNKKYKNRIRIVEEIEKPSFYENIYKEMIYEIKDNNLKIKDVEKKIIDSLRIVGLKPSLLTHNRNTLSTSEKKKYFLAKALLSNPELIVIKEAFKGFELKTEKKYYMLLQKIKEQYNKTIIII